MLVETGPHAVLTLFYRWPSLQNDSSVVTVRPSRKHALKQYWLYSMQPSKRRETGEEQYTANQARSLQ